MLQIELQRTNEMRFSRKHIDKKIRASIDKNPVVQKQVQLGIQLVNKYLEGTYYASKMKRIAQLKDMDIEALVVDIFVGMSYYQGEGLFIGATAELASRLGFDDKLEAITTVAELVAILCETDAFDIGKNKTNNLVVLSRIQLEEELVEYINHSTYLPPMICKPLILKNNKDSGYLTHKESLVLGKGNHHEGDLCLDVLNKMNQVALKLDTQFLSKEEEMPTFELDTPRKRDDWNNFKEQSYYFYSLMEQAGNKFYLTHAVDKRGRIYSRGFHVHSQGPSFKKAMLEFAQEELVEGAP